MPYLLSDECRKVSIEEAIQLSKTTNLMIWWRPNSALPEKEQYALVYGE